MRTAAIVAVSVLVLLANVASGSAACGTENSGCAVAGAPRMWLGRVLDGAGNPVAAAHVEYYFASNQPSGYPLEKALPVVTDGQGRYCVRWPTETALAHVSVVGATSQSLSLVSPDASGEAGTSYLIASSGQRGLTVTNRGWQPARDATDECTTGQPAWYRVDSVKSNWRYRLLIYLPLLAMALAIAGTVARRRGAQAVGRWAASSAAGIAATGALLYILVWITHSV